MNPLLIGVAWLLFKPKKGKMRRNPSSEIKYIMLQSIGSEVIANLVIAQAKFESNNYTSNLFLKTNNAFGYKCVKGSTLQSGCTVKSPEGDYYASYHSVRDSALEISLWIQRRVKEKKFKLSDLKDPVSYAKALKSVGFFGGSADAYARGMQNYLS